MEENNMENKDIQTTFYCDHDHPVICSLAEDLNRDTENESAFIKKVFYHIRDHIRFGGDLWQVKASDTLIKGYGACYNKNLLFMAILRNRGIGCKLAANPMCRAFTRPCTGAAHRFFSYPYYHCFTLVFKDGKWIHLDPTLDEQTYTTFFKSAGVAWGIEFNDNGMPPLYEESIMGQCKTYDTIDSALKSNLDSWFLFRNEPAFLVKFWLWMGNMKMWKSLGAAADKEPLKGL